MTFDGKPPVGIGMPPPIKRFCDLDLWSHDLENVINIMWTWLWV